MESGAAIGAAPDGDTDMADLIDAMVADGRLDTVASALGDKPEEPKAFVPPVLEGYPHELPAPGIYFNMDEDAYFAAPALSCSGIKKLASSPTLYWATTPWLNADVEEREEKDHFTIGKAYHARILEGPETFNERFSIALDKKAIPDLCVTVDDIKARIVESGGEPKGKKKEDFVAQLLELDPDAPIWESLCARHAEANEGKAMLPFDVVKRIEYAAMQIERHEELGAAVRGGHPETSLFWIDERTGVPMKARVDYLKLKMLVDLKTLENKFENSPERAIQKAIANLRYYLQPTVYWEGVEAVKTLLRRGEAATDATDEQKAWLEKWAARKEPPAWLFIFQQKGVAPVTRGVFFPQSTLYLVAKEIIAEMKRRYRKNAELWGTDAWLDIAPTYDLADDEIPSWSTEI